jgi:sugar phosphate isomerase/epimerase
MTSTISRRGFFAMAGAAGVVAATGKNVPVGLELYSVRDLMKTDELGTVRQVAKLGYAGVEFYGPYMEWTTDHAKEVRKVLDDTGMKCFSTHNGANSFDADRIDKAIELNRIVGSKFIVMASAGRIQGPDGWKTVAEKLTKGAEKFKSAGLQAGYHNHQTEFRPVDGVRPIEVIAKNTPKSVMLQLDVGTCLEAGSDPVAWINANPGRINSIHCKDWSPDAGKGYRVLFGEGAAPWKKIFEAAEKVGGIQYYLIEQEGYSLPSMETAQQCLVNFKKLKA